MIKIYAQNVRGGGGVPLLKYVFEEFVEASMVSAVHYDGSVILDKYPEIRYCSYNSLHCKLIAFCKKEHRVLYFGNLPPLRKSVDSCVFFHNPFIGMSFSDLFKQSSTIFVKYSLQKIYLILFSKNVNFFICQTNEVKNQLKKVVSVPVYVLPIFQRIAPSEIKSVETELDFFYPSFPHEHKNHLNLLVALKILEKRKLKVKVGITIPAVRTDLFQAFSEFDASPYIQVVNFELITRGKVLSILKSSRALIFPSLQETFGLPLIEAAQLDKPIIASDREYVYQVVKPSLTFDPLSAESIANTIETFLKNPIREGAELRVESKIENLIQIFASISDE